MVPPNQQVLDVAKLDVDIPIGNKFDDYAFHQGSHPDYTNMIDNKIKTIEFDFMLGNIDKSQALSSLISMTDKAKEAISIGKGVPINKIIF